MDREIIYEIPGLIEADFGKFVAGRTTPEDVAPDPGPGDGE